MIARKLFGLVALNILLLCLYQTVLIANGHTPTVYELALFWGLMGVYSIVVVISYHDQKNIPKAPPVRETLNADPWELQRRLMQASGQTIADHPVVHNGSLLYGALILEEAAETFGAIIKTMSRHRSATPTAIQDETPFIIMLVLSSIVSDMSSASIRLRELLTEADVEIPMTHDEAVELLDGTTDLAVVNCGFALASGVPGSSAYFEVVYSNLSKVNPATGVIDKTRDGKWIKGECYVEPDLSFVLNHHQDSLRASKQRGT